MCALADDVEVTEKNWSKEKCSKKELPRPTSPQKTPKVKRLGSKIFAVKK